MRIAQVITLYLPEFVGGATLACARIARGLADRGHDVQVFCGRPEDGAEPYGERTWTVDGIPVTGVNVASGYVALAERSYRHPEVDAVFARFLARTRPDVVHVHSVQALGASLLAVAAAHAIPVVVTMHDWWWFCARLFLVDPAGFVCPPRVASARCHCAPDADLVGRRRYLDAMRAHAACVLTPSRTLADAVIANGTPASRVAVSPNGVERPAIPVRPRPGPVRFGYFGGPDNRLKGLPTLLAAVAELDAGGWDLTLFAAADARAAIPAVAADRVRAVAPFPPDALGDVLGRLDCLVVPSLMRESYSLVTREALAAGVPVIATDSGGPAEILRDGRNGLLVATGDAHGLARAMRRLVLEPGLRATLREGAAATRITTVAEQVAALEEVYARVTASVDHAATAPFAATTRHVLFVAGMGGAPFRYRVQNLRAQLQAAGIATRALAAPDPQVPEAIDEAELVVFYRTAMDPWIAACVAHARARGRHVVFSCDDLLFDPTNLPHAALALLPEEQRRWWEAAVARYAATLAAADAFLASTEPLAAAAARLGVPAFVVRNGLGDAQLAVAEAAVKAAWPRRSVGEGVRRVVYASGTTMHDLDFAVVEPELAAVLAARPDVHLRLIGPLRTGAALAPFAARIERRPFVPWQELAALLADADVNLAPLAAPDAFAAAKSEVKYLEAAAVGVPTVATPTPAFRHAITPGRNGELAATGAEWRVALGALLDEPGRARRLGDAARNDVFLRYGPATQTPDLLAALESVMARTPRVDPAATPLAGDAAAQAVRFPGLVGRADLEPDDADAGPAQLVRDTPSPVLAPGRAVGQTFVTTGSTLVRVDVAVGTDGRPSAPRLVLAIGETPGGPALRRVVLPARPLADEGWVGADLPPLPTVAGRPLYLWVEGEGDPITLWTATATAPVPDGLHLDHRPAPGALAFRTFVVRTA